MVVGSVRGETPDGNLDCVEKSRECGGVVPAARCEFGSPATMNPCSVLLREPRRPSGSMNSTTRRVQRGPDREVLRQVPPLASAKTVLRCYPRGNCILAQPDRDVPAAPEATLVLPPVPDSVLLLVLAVDSARLRCDHDVTPPISMMDRNPPSPLACSLTPIHAPTPF